MSGTILDVPLHELARTRFLNYAVSVITSRALPDVRDGLKPVQRRILYTMAHDLGLAPDKPPLKCAKVVGSVLGSYHPHGDSAVYEALVRLAQDWVLRSPLVEGQGNFGSLDGDSPAAYRYTEARLRPLAMEFVAELDCDTVDFRANFDDTTTEPVVMPARFPQLVVNGCAGIAVGVATNMPPHNLREVLDACLALIARPDLSTSDLLLHVKGPDFPTGGEVLIEREQLLRLYEDGQGAVVMRGEVQPEESPGKWQRLVITSVPYLVAKSRMVEEIAAQIEAGKIPGLVNVRDESAEDVRVVLELNPEAPARRVLQQLYKLTPLQSTFHANFTCLGPDGPARMGLRELLRAFLDFRHEVVTRRLRHELGKLEDRLLLLEGFARVFANLDRALELIRGADGRADAARKLCMAFALDEEQAQAVLELKLYRIGRRDVEEFRREHEQLLARRGEIQNLLASERGVWELVRQELQDLRRRFGDARRSKLRAPDKKRLEQAPRKTACLTRAGWIASDATAEREGDPWMFRAEADTLMLFTNLGGAFSASVAELPAEPVPVQKLFNFRDGERVVAALPCDEKRAEALYVAADGCGARFALDPYRTPSGKPGRRFARPEADVLNVLPVEGNEVLTLATRRGCALSCPVSELELKTGRGAPVLRLEEGDRVLAFGLGTVEVARSGRPFKLTPRRVPPGKPGREGIRLILRGEFEPL